MADYQPIDFTSGKNYIPSYKPPESRPGGISTGVNTSVTGAPGSVPGQPGLWQNPDFFSADGMKPNNDSGFNWLGDGSEKNPGMLIPGLNAAAGIGNLYLGNRALNLSQDQFNFSRNQYNQDYNAQADAYNTNLTASKSRGLLDAGYDSASDPGFEAALASYVEANSIKQSTIG